ncbi:MAG: peptidoglycan-binding protein [Propionibacteriales bacterium]|nr:peptidoglycan-binding protein [Propionibacteriales bacterium]
MCNEEHTSTLDRRGLLRLGGLAAAGAGALSLGLGTVAPTAQAGGRTTIYGAGACDCMKRSLPMLEDRLRKAGGIVRDLSGLITQGAYSTGVAASKGTHGSGGAIDMAYSTVNTNEKVLAWRRSGVAMWPRYPSQGPWGYHGHGVWIGCPHLAGGAARQVGQYRDGGNGLGGRDTFPRPGYITWSDALAQWSGGGDKPPAPALPNFPDPSPEVFAGAGKNPDKVILYGISDKDLGERLRAHGFDPAWYGGNLVWLLADFARSLSHLPKGAELVGRVKDNPPNDIIWADFRQQWEAGTKGGYGSDKKVSVHSVRAIQSGLVNFGHRVVEDGMYGAQTRDAVRAWQISKRGVPANSPAASGIVNLSDAMYLNFASGPQPRGVRTRHSL